MKVLLVGLGNASWLYAENDPTKVFITHTHSILNFDEFKIIGGCDTDSTIASAWASRFGLPVFSEISEVNAEVDLIVIAVNHSAILEMLLETLQRWPHAKVLVEKPVVINRDQLAKVQNLPTEDLDRIWINFPRLFQPESQVLKELIQLELERNPENKINWEGTYSGGFLNTSSHFISLLSFIFGSVELSLIDEPDNLLLSYSIGGARIQGRMLELQSKQSTASISIRGAGLNIEYLGGGEEIIIASEAHGDFKLETTRGQYQLEVYRGLLLQWNGFHSNLGTLKSEIKNLNQMINLQNDWEKIHGACE